MYHYNSICKILKPGNRIRLLIAFMLLMGCLHFANAQTDTSQPEFVRNAGIGGNNTIDMLKRIRKDCLYFNPDLTIVMAGTNDMNSVKYVPLAQYKVNMIRLLDSIQASGSKVLLMNILPFYTPYLLTRHPASFYGTEGPSGRQAAVNEALSVIAAKRHIPLLDIHYFFEKAGDIGLDKGSLIRNMANSGLTDGIHPTADGYRLIAALVYQNIISEGLPHQRVVCFGDSITKGDGGTNGKSYPAYLKRLLQNNERKQQQEHP